MRTLRKRVALAICRAAGLDVIAANRAELDELRESNRKLENAYRATLNLLKEMAKQTNSNTLMLKRWLEGSPSLQVIERSHSKRGNGKSGLILPPMSDLRVDREHP